MNNMKTISEKLLSYQRIFTLRNSLVIFVIGLLLIFPQQLFIWSMVAFPEFNFILIIVGFILSPLWIFFTFLILALSALHTTSSFIINSQTKVISLCFSIVLITTFLNVDKNPNFRAGHPAFLFGAKTRLLWSGGSEIVKKDALGLLSQETDEDGYIISKTWSSSLRMLGATTIKVDKDSQTVAIFIHGNLIYDFDSFGYFITNGEEPNIDLVKVDSHETTISYWKLEDGVYFFNRKW